MSDIKTISNKNLRELVSLHFPSNQKDPTTDRDYAYLDLDWVENEAYQGYKHWMSLFNFGRFSHFMFFSLHLITHSFHCGTLIF